MFEPASMVFFLCLLAGSVFFGWFASINQDKPQPGDVSGVINDRPMLTDMENRLLADTVAEMQSARDEFDRAAREYCVSREALAAMPAAQGIIKGYNRARQALALHGIHEPPITGEHIDVRV